MPPTPPLALIVSGNEWLARSIESVLSSNGYEVVRAYTSRQALEYSRAVQPDAVFVSTDLNPAIDSADLCRALRADLFLTPDTPIILISAHPTSRRERLRALRAGAWEVLGLPLDAEEILIQLGTYLTARLEARRVREECLVDPLTGLYNVRGLLRQARELGAAALRHRHALACIVFSLDGNVSERVAEPGAGPMTPIERVALLLRERCRAGDTLGRLGHQEFVVLAPDTGPAGALALARRLAGAAEAGDPDVEHARQTQVRAGLFAVPDFTAASIQPIEMLVRATTALRRTRPGQVTDRIRSFDANGPVAII
jgi:diguanylate cyclase (GGDEF)-like protein